MVVLAFPALAAAALWTMALPEAMALPQATTLQAPDSTVLAMAPIARADLERLPLRRG